MTVRTQGPRRGEFIVSEANGTLSRDVINLAADVGQPTLAAGTVLGRVTATGNYVVYTDGAIDGSDTAVAVLLDPVRLPASGTVSAVAIMRLAEVNRGELVWFNPNNATLVNNGLADLAAIDIVAR
jgi:hypothetical protein